MSSWLTQGDSFRRIISLLTAKVASLERDLAEVRAADDRYGDSNYAPASHGPVLTAAPTGGPTVPLSSLVAQTAGHAASGRPAGDAEQPLSGLPAPLVSPITGGASGSKPGPPIGSRSSLPPLSRPGSGVSLASVPPPGQTVVPGAAASVVGSARSLADPADAEFGYAARIEALEAAVARRDATDARVAALEEALKRLQDSQAAGKAAVDGLLASTPAMRADVAKATESVKALAGTVATLAGKVSTVERGPGNKHSLSERREGRREGREEGSNIPRRLPLRLGWEREPEDTHR